MKLTSLIAKFNVPDVHLVISAWPEEGVNHGIAWYTKMVTEEAAKSHGQRFVVLAEKGADDKPRLYQRGKILVLRVFDNAHPQLYPTILTWLRQFDRINRVSVHSEFGVNAGLKHYVLLLPFLALIRLTGRHVTYYAHNVIADVSFLLSHVNLPPSPYLVDLANAGVILHTKLLAALVDTIVVLDEALAIRLGKLLGPSAPRKIVTTHIPVRAHKALSQARAKRLLGIPQRHRVILAFGFVSSYKGTDWLMRAFVNLAPRNTTLVIAGGEAHSLKTRPYYQKYFRAIRELAETNPAVRLTGFVPEGEIARYFSAADMVVLPYRGLMGASGALSHALAYGKPFLLSRELGELWKNMDVKEAARAGSINPDSLFFPLTLAGMRHILNVAKSTRLKRKLSLASKALARSRAIEKLTSDTYNQIYRVESDTHENTARLSFGTKLHPNAG